MQGKTLDRADVDLRHVFAPSMVFVAMSRVRRLQDLRLRNFDKSKIKPLDPAIHDFQRKFVAVSDRLAALELSGEKDS